MATLNREEQAKVDRVAQLQQARRDGTQHVSDALLAEAEQHAGWAIRNAETRERLQAERQAEADAKAAAFKAKQDEKAMAAQEAFRRLARSRFNGTDQQFASAWPRILEDWLVRNALGEAEPAPVPMIRF